MHIVQETGTLLHVNDVNNTYKLEKQII